MVERARNVFSAASNTTLFSLFSAISTSVKLNKVRNPKY
jgi:hypothetical protein